LAGILNGGLPTMKPIVQNPRQIIFVRDPEYTGILCRKLGKCHDQIRPGKADAGPLPIRAFR